MHSIEFFLSSLKEAIESTKVEPRHLITSSSNNGFETLVSEILKQLGYLDTHPSVNSVSVILNFGHHFPDITVYLGDGVRIHKYGIELKSTQSSSWAINGGSFFESLTDPDYQEIFVFFGKIRKGKEDHYTVKYKPYWESLSNIVVTHSPRYLIDMDKSSVIFHSFSEYQNVRNLDKSGKTRWVQQYLRENAGTGTWYLPDQIPPQEFSLISNQQKQRLIAEAYVLFPADLLKPRSANYKRISEFWLEQYYVYTTNIRDKFSASGKQFLHGILVPHTIFTLANHSRIIRQLLESASKEFSALARKEWKNIPHKQSSDLLDEYKSVLDSISKTYNYADLFQQAGISFSEAVLMENS